jgi:hypothetical protein
VTTFFHAWRRRQAELQAAEWEAEQEAARKAVQEVPPWIRSHVSRLIETLLEGADSEVAGALEELHKLIVDDAVEFLK